MIAFLLAFLRVVARWRGRRLGRWIRTSTGNRFWPLDPRVGDVFAADIARGLSRTCRYTGQLARSDAFYSVAEHSLLVSRAAAALAASRGLTPIIAARLGLLHDAAEAYVADVATPVKSSWIMAGYRAVENHLLGVILRAHWLDRVAPAYWDLIHEVDRRILSDEMTTLMRDADVSSFGEPLGVEILELAPEAAERQFLDEYARLRLWS